MRRLARVRWQRRCRRKRRRPLLEPGVEQPDQLGDGVGLDGGGLLVESRRRVLDVIERADAHVRPRSARLCKQVEAQDVELLLQRSAGAVVLWPQQLVR